jgi:predicted small lipoprotein YifL
VIARGRALAVTGALALTIALALTGCGKLGAGAVPDPTLGSPSGAGSTPPSAPPADDSATLDGISQDLDSTDTANTEAGSNADAGDQAGATGDEP